jgi:hypothetical protein
MRAPLTFDTHAYVKRLVAAGMPEAQAEVQAEALADLAQAQADAVLAQVVTREDLRLSVAELDRKIEALDRKIETFRGDVREMELRLTARLEAELRKQLLWFFGMLIVLAGALVALLRAVPSLP